MHVQLLLQLSVTGTRFGGRGVRFRRCGDSNHYFQHLTVCDESLHHSLLVDTGHLSSTRQTHAVGIECSRAEHLTRR